MSRISRHEERADREVVSALNPEAPAVEGSPGLDTEAGDRSLAVDEVEEPTTVDAPPPPKRRRKLPSAE